MNDILYLNCFSGISGDMMLGVLLDLLGENDLGPHLKGLDLTDYKVTVSRSRKDGIAGVDVKVVCVEKHPHRGLSDVMKIIEKSNITAAASQKAIEAFRLLADAEGAVHGMSAEEVHFHEVGAVDSIVDIVGSCVLMDVLKPGKVVASPVNVGSGTVKCAHGELPVPAPATMKLLEGVPVYSRGQAMERTTPTGAVLLRVFADSFGVIPTGVIVRTGYGIGDHDSDIVNVLQGVILQETPFPVPSRGSEHISPGNDVSGHSHEHGHDHSHAHDHPHHHEHDHEHEHEPCKTCVRD